jgi:single-stranded-DNA-specific exonuclease
MKYKLIGTNDTSNIKNTILKNRGVTDIKGYLNLNINSLHNYSLLDNIMVGIELYKNTINNNLPIYIVVDCDPDGYTSASTLYHYTKYCLKYNNVYYIIQEGKKHGLCDNVMDILKEKEIGLVCLPDAGTNDFEPRKTLSDLGYKILILDHHQRELLNDNALIINNQVCEYPNKNLSGVGIVYKFLQALDDEYWLSNAYDYIDMVALGNISDVMDLRECETKYIVDTGLKNIIHPLFKALINKQSYSIKNIEFPTITDISFYITPLLNAMIRIGNQDEKELLFKAFIKDYEEYEYTPRKSKNNPNPETIMESIYDRVARLCYNAKQRQTKIQEKAINEVVDLYDDKNNENAICFINVSKLENVTTDITGLVAIKIADRYSKPCLILRKDSSKSDDNNIIFSGSGRNINDSFIDDLKEELSNSNLFEMVAGHSNAFGVSIKKENVPVAIKYYNEKFKDEFNTKVYKVDFVFTENIDYKVIKDINSMQNIFSGFLKEPLIMIENVRLDLIGFELFGNEEKQHWKFQNGVIEYIKFNVPKDDEISNIDTFTYSTAYLNIIGKTTINTYGGKAIPQVIIEDYEIINKE